MYSFMYHCMTIAIYITVILEYTEETYRSNICNCIFCCRSVLKNIRICRRLQAIKTRMMHWTRDHSFRGQWLFQYKQNQQANLQNSQTNPDLVELESSSAHFFVHTCPALSSTHPTWPKRHPACQLPLPTAANVAAPQPPQHASVACLRPRYHDNYNSGLLLTTLCNKNQIYIYIYCI